MATPEVDRQGRSGGSQRWAAMRRALTQLPANAAVLAEDECDLDLLAWVRPTWIVRGQRQRVWTPGQNQHRTLFGALDIRTGARWERAARTANSQEFIAFLDQLLAGHRRAPIIVLVLDNIIIRSSRAVRAWLADHPRILLLYGARDCPHANPEERVWGELKRDLANAAPPAPGSALPRGPDPRRPAPHRGPRHRPRDPRHPPTRRTERCLA